MIHLALFGGAITALIWAGLALHVPGAVSVGSPALTNVFVALLAAAGAAYLLAVRRVVANPPRGRAAFALVVLVAAAIRIPLVSVVPFLSSDVYRYVWDGRVQNAGINPYRYVPADAALAPLRDAAVYPHVNRKSYARTIYPPAAQMVFAAVARLSDSVLAMKLAMLAFEAIGMACAAVILRRAGLPQTRLLIYAWNPLAAWAFAGNGHVDAIAVGFVGLALFGRAAGRMGWTGAALGGAALTKFIPVVIGPALWRRRDWRLPAMFLAVAVLLYLPYGGVGWHVLGFLPQYGQEEGLSGGQGVWLLAGLGELLPIGHAATVAYFVAAAVALGGFWLILERRPRPRTREEDISRVCGDAGLLAAATMVAISPHYPWYFAWIALPACVRPYRCVVWLSVAPLLLYLDPFHERFIWPSLVYVPAIVLAAMDCRTAGFAMPIPSLASERSG